MGARRIRSYATDFASCCGIMALHCSHSHAQLHVPLYHGSFVFVEQLLQVMQQI